MNPIEQEVGKLVSSWDEFLVSERSIAHWLINPADQSLVNAFVKINEQFDEKTGTWFIQLTSPFESSAAFACELNEELNHLIVEGLDDALAAEAEENTCAPEANRWQRADAASASGLPALLATIHQLLALFDKSLEQLTLVIKPAQIKSIDDYAHWWQELCRLGRSRNTWPAALKWLVLDEAASGYLTKHFAPYQDQALTQTPAINLTAAAQAIAEQADDGSDAAKLRLLFLRLNTAIAEQNLTALHSAAEDALIITRQNQWPDMTTTVLLTRAGGLLNMQHYTPAIADYQQAQVFAALGVNNNIPGCEKLLLQAMLFTGTGFFLAEQLEQAASEFERTAGAAEEQNDLWTALEAWRMAAFSCERLKQPARAWQLALSALEVGKKMPAETREQSTLGFVGQAMLRLKPAAQNEIQHNFAELLGPDWLKKLEGAAA
ncbi:MAG: hypothetical protein U1F46_00010 [Marinagarivorans sp.]